MLPNYGDRLTYQYRIVKFTAGRLRTLLTTVDLPLSSKKRNNRNAPNACIDQEKIKCPLSSKLESCAHRSSPLQFSGLQLL
jgi:hypothetical protein